MKIAQISRTNNTDKNMKPSLLSLLLLFLMPNTGEANKIKAIEPGVSYALALQRKAAIKDIRYNIKFNVPKAMNEKVTGNETISFYYSATDKKDLLLDFKAEPDQLLTIMVNEKHIDKPQLTNEHIIVPYSNLQKGKNTINISFVSGDKSLNRSPEYMYTLFVPDRARTVFPCFDQPDLKATFKLQLTIPEEWTSVANERPVKTEKKNGKQIINFQETKLLPTYLFSFVTGKFEKKTFEHKGEKMTAYYRETDPDKVAQLNTIFKELEISLEWLEKYTNMNYPFGKYDLVIVPGFQFGGMEHAGAILYNDKQMFLSNDPTQDEELQRMQVIAHETTHMWFGDLVTMRWFNDVWTKEVFANFMADKIVSEYYPKVNHQLNFMKTYELPALSEDRTLGTHPIQQVLDNLNVAGLLYGFIIYDKAPIVLRNLEMLMGSKAFQKGIQHFLHHYAYDNATWNEMIEEFDKQSPQNDLKQFSEVWVKQKGMPDIHIDAKDDKIVINQHDVYNRGICWQQQFSIGLVYKDTIVPVNAVIDKCTVEIPIKEKPLYLLPNYNGLGYGHFSTDKASMDYQLCHWMDLKNEVSRLSILMNIFENYLSGSLKGADCCNHIIKGLNKENNALIASTCVKYLTTICSRQDGEARNHAEQELMNIAQDHPIRSCRQQMLRGMMNLMTNKEIVEKLYSMWKNKSNPLLDESDYTNLSYQLAIRMPQQYKQILEEQRGRLTNIDRIREFDYISRACTPDTTEQKKLFQSLLVRENRSVEPWVEKTLSLLNHPLRESFANQYILRGLQEVLDIQRSGDIFFPKKWSDALLGDHQSAEAREIVNNFLESNPDYPVNLKNKILHATFMMNIKTY